MTTRRSEKSLKDLYELTAQISIPEITPVLEGSYRIQGPVDDPDHDIGRMSSSVIPSVKGRIPMKENFRTRAKSGTCNVCSAPCSSCMHFNRDVSVMESNVEGPCSINNFQRNDSHSFVDAHERPPCKGRVCDGHATSETSNFRNASSSQDSYSENAESKASLIPTFTYNASKDVDILLKVSPDKVDKLLSKGTNVPDKQFIPANINTPSLHHHAIVKSEEEERPFECLGDNMSCIDGDKDEEDIKQLKKNLDLTGHNKEAQTDTFHNIKILNPESAALGFEDLKERSLGCSTPNGCLQEMSSCKTEPSVCHAESSVCHAEPMEDLATGTSIVACVGELSTDSMSDECHKVHPVTCDLGSPSRNDTFPESKPFTESTSTGDAGNSYMANNPSDKSATSWEGHDTQPQSLSEGEKSDSEVIEHDVNVCDICGDAGREDSLATCSRCSDGAEHTYCMRIKLDKVPEGDWLCEECKLKEDSESQRLNITELVPAITKSSSPNETAENSENPSKAVQKLGRTSSIVKGSNKGLKQLADKKQAVQLNASPRKRPPEPCGRSIEISSPRKKVALSHEDLFRNPNLSNFKPSNIVQGSGSQRTPVGLDLSKSPKAPPNGPLSRSCSFNNGSSMMGKIRKLGNIPAMRNTIKEISLRETRKDGPARVMSRTTSFGRPSLGVSNADIVNKNQGLNSPRFGDPIGVNPGKDKTVLENKIISSDRPLASPASSTGGVSSKFDIKSSPLDGKSSNASEPNALAMSKGRGIVDSGRALKRSQSYVSKPQPNGPCDSEGQKIFQAPKEIGVSSTGIESPNSYRSAPHTLDPALRDEKSKLSSLATRQAGCSSGRILRCQRCNETGHATQFCPIDMLRVSALKPSDRSSKEWTTRNNNKSKDTVGATILDTEEQTAGVLHEQYEDPTAVNADLHHPERAADKRDALKSMDTFRFDVKPCAETLKAPGLSSCKLSVLSVIPEREFIWQGDFEVLRSGSGTADVCAGVQAHLSTGVSPKVLSVVDKFSDRVRLEEVPCSHAWPPQFLGSNPKEDHIALYFFARDFESYEKHYQKLLDNLIKKDLALKGSFGRVELLIFTSNKLPENSQRWNNLFFLWGVFRVRNVDPPEALPDAEEKCCNPTSCEELLVQQSPSPIPPAISISNKEDSNDEKESNPPTIDRPSKGLADELKKDGDSFVVSPKGTESGTCPSRTACPVVEEPFSKEVAGSDQSLNCSLDSDVSHLVETSSEPHGLPNSCRDSTLQNAALHTHSQSEIESMDDGQEDRKDLKFHQNEGIDLVVPASMPAKCIYDEQGTSGKQLVKEEAIMETDIPVRREILLDLNETEFQTEIDCHSWESTMGSRKHRDSISVDNIPVGSGELSKNSHDSSTGKDKYYHSYSYDEAVHKKRKLYHDGFVNGDDFIEDEMDCKLSSKVRPLSAGIRQEHLLGDGNNYHETDFTETSTSGEHHFFVSNLPTTRDSVAEDVIHVLSSDDDGAPESSTPDLELALWGRKKSTRRGSSPLVHCENPPDELPLSLSLSFPASGRDQTAQAISSTEQHLPEHPSVNAPLFLFGRYTNP